MTLATIRVGDIVLDHMGRRFHAHVTGKTKRELEVEPIERAVSYRTAKAREVLDVWRKSRPRSQRPAEPEPAGAA